MSHWRVMGEYKKQRAGAVAVDRGLNGNGVVEHALAVKLFEEWGKA